jgi:hypothetical protein
MAVSQLKTLVAPARTPGAKLAHGTFCPFVIAWALAGQFTAISKVTTVIDCCILCFIRHVHLIERLVISVLEAIDANVVILLEIVFAPHAVKVPVRKLGIA